MPEDTVEEVELSPAGALILGFVAVCIVHTSYCAGRELKNRGVARFRKFKENRNTAPPE